MLGFRRKSKCKKKYTKYKDGKRHAQYEHYIEYEMYIKWIFQEKAQQKFTRRFLMAIIFIKEKYSLYLRTKLSTSLSSSFLLSL